MDDADLRLSDFDGFERFGKFFCSRLHQAAMRRNGYRQRQRTFGSRFFGGVHGTLDGGGITRDHNLSGRIEVDGFDHFALRGFCTNGFNLFVFQAEDRRHRTYALRHGRLHQFGAQADEFDCIRKIQCAGGDECSVFAEAVAGNDGWRFAARFQISTVNGNSGS